MSIKAVSLAALVFVAFYNILFFPTATGVGSGFLVLALNVFFYATRNKADKNLFLAVGTSSLAVIFGFLFAVRANEIVRLVDFLTTVFFSLAALYLYKSDRQLTLQVFHFVLTPLIAAESSFMALLRLFSQRDSAPEDKKDSTAFWIRGLAVSLPILGILLLLLVQADPIFRKLTENALSNMGERIILSCLLFASLLGFGLSRMLEKFKQESESFHLSEGKFHELSIIIASVSTLFLLFILVQFRYLFSSVGERELHELGINSLTYSEYVRKGFFELLIASSIASGIVAYLFKYLHKFKETEKFVLQILSSLLTIETGLLLLSAAKRLALYADAHGLTRARIFGFIFLLWLMTFLIIFMVRIFKEVERKWFFTGFLTATLVALLLVNIVNVDGLIATQYKPTVNGEVDYYYIAKLSPDASQAWVPAIENSGQIINSLSPVASPSAEDGRKLYWASYTLSALKYQIGFLLTKYGTSKQINAWHQVLPINYDTVYQVRGGWQAFNFSEYLAYRQVADDMNFYLQIGSLLKEADVLENRIPPDVRQKIMLDRSLEPPLAY